MTVRLVIAAVVATLAAAVSAAAEVVYTSARCTPGCHSELWRVADDGSGARKLLDGAYSPAFDLLGARIAYGNGINVMDADGSNRRTITPSGMDPTWSRTGTHLMYTESGEAGCLRPMIVDAEGASPPTPVPGSECGDRLARFSPDGARIIHLRHGSVPGGPASIVSRPLAGGPAHEVVSRGAAVGPFTLEFSPDGRMLALALRGAIYTLDLVTGELVQRSPQDSEVAWSPIGPTLFFSRHRADGRASAIHRLNLGLPDAQPVPITDDVHQNYDPSWGALGIALPELPVLDALAPVVALLPAELSAGLPGPPRAVAAAAGQTVSPTRLGDLFALDPSGVRAVDVALARQSGARCRTVVGRRVQRRRRSCRPRAYRRAAVTQIAARTDGLPRGLYRVWVRASDGAGNRTARMLRVRV